MGSHNSYIKEHGATVPDLIDPVLGFRGFGLEYKSYEKVKVDRYPNAFKLDLTTGQLVPDRSSPVEDEMLVPVMEEGCSLTSPQYWRRSGPGKNYFDRQMTAECGAGKGHLAPDADCRCGLYCYFDPKDIQQGKVSGIVTCWGKLEVHALGMRVQHMQIEALFSASDISQLGEKWGIPTFSCLKKQDIPKMMLEMAPEYGNPLPEGMRPKVISYPIDEGFSQEALWRLYMSVNLARLTDV